MPPLSRFFLPCLIVFGLTLPSPAPRAAEGPRVVVSIAPLHGLASAIMDGVATPVLLLDQKFSPHDVALRPSQARALARADIVLWIGPALERFMTGMIANASPEQLILTALDLPGLEKYPLRTRTDWSNDQDDDPHGVTDPHIWLSIRNARVIAAALTARLVAIDPAEANIYARNLASLDNDLAVLNADIQDIIGPHRDTPFVLLHDSFQYLEKAYGLHPVGALTTSNAGGISAKRLHDMKTVMTQRSVRCIAADPLGQSPLAKRLSQSPGIQLAALDPLGKSIALGSRHYQSMMRANVQNLASCLRLR